MQKPTSSCYVLDAEAEPPFLTKECVPVSATGDTNLAAPCVGPTFGICWHFKKMGMEGSTAVPDAVMVGLLPLLHGREFLKLGIF